MTRLQGGGHYHHALRHHGAERSGPALSPGDNAIDRLPQTGGKGIYLKQQLQDKLVEHKHYIDKHGQDFPEIRNWNALTLGGALLISEHCHDDCLPQENRNINISGAPRRI
jgi:hypothetical protein